MDQHSKAPDDGEFVTWREFLSELKSFRMEQRLLIVIGFSALKFQLPDAVTAGSMATVLAGAAIKSFLSR